MDLIDIKKEFLRVCQDINLMNQEFIYACEGGNLDIVRYVLTSPDLKEHVGIHAYNDLGFRCACTYGHLEIVKYLLTSPDLKYHADIHASGDGGFRIACAYRHLDIVKYLLDYHKDYQNQFLYTIKDFVNEGYVDFLPYLKSNKKEDTEECEIFL